MAVELFQGKYITADDASRYIDVQTISDGCKMLNDAAQRLAKIAKKIDNLKETLDKQTLSVQGDSMEDIIEFYEKNTNDFSVYINELSTTIMEATQRVMNRKQLLLNEDAKIEEAKEAALHEDIEDIAETEKTVEE